MLPDKQLELQKGGKTLWLRVTDDRRWVQFTMIGARLGMLAIDFVTPNRLREIGRVMMRLANEMQGKTNLRSIKGRKGALPVRALR
jgi:hypothetical protein